LEPEKELQEKELLNKITQDILRLHREIKYKEKRGKNVDKGREYSVLKKELIEKHPGEAENIGLLFGVKRLTEIEKDLEDKEKRRKMPKEVFVELVSWQQRIAKLLLKKDKEVCESFWKGFTLVFRDFYDSPEWRARFRGNQNGIIGQVGVYKTLEYFNLRPEFSLPQEDALEQTDIYCTLGKEPVQTKYSSWVSKPLIATTDEVNFPSPTIEQEGVKTYIAAKEIEQMTRFKTTCDKMAKIEGKKVRGLYIAAPWGSFDETTGKPSQKFLAQAEPELKRHFELVN